jgi:hypothetical protein
MANPNAIKPNTIEHAAAAANNVHMVEIVT